MQINTIIGAGNRIEYAEPANFLRILGAETAVIKIDFFRAGAIVASVEDVGAGYAESFDIPIDRVAISSAVEQNVSIVLRLGSDIRYDTPPTGDVNVKNVNGLFNQWTQSAGIAAKLVSPAKINRRYLLIQNNHPALDVYLDMTGGNPFNGGVKIEAGGSYELSGFVPTNAITIGSPDGENNSVVVVEG
jgi:hypothetical protein